MSLTGTLPVILPPPTREPYKYQWARHVAREKLEADFLALKEKIAESNLKNWDAADSIEKLALAKSNDFKHPGSDLAGAEPQEHMKIGIIGAGVAGMFTAMILDQIKERIPGLKDVISYDILEAAGEKRLGGRLYTHEFTDKPHDYYDVGAMRFPHNEVMKRTYQLFEYLDMVDDLVPYYMSDYDGVCPSYFNDVQRVGPVPKGEENPYGINTPGDEIVPKALMKRNPSDVIEEAIKPFVDRLLEDLDANPKTGLEAPKKDAQGKVHPPDSYDHHHSGWELLMTADSMSTRQFLRSTVLPGIPECVAKGPGYSFNTIEWLETFTYATGWYNQSLAETVLESLDFYVPTKKNPEAGNKVEKKPWDKTGWVCVEGGAQKIARKMAAKLKKQPEFNKQVTGIATDDDRTMSLKIKDEPKPRKYFAVFNSTTLGALQRMDLTKAGLRYGTKQAIRSLGYGASCKVGMKFKTAWWMKSPHFIKEGGIARTDLPLRVCVYPSYNIHDDPEKSAVLLCSYTWAQDAQRIGALISPDSPQNEDDLRELLIHNLALLHSKPGTYKEVYDVINKNYETHHAYDWYADNNMSGAFAYFGPSQFSEMWPELIRPNGWLFLIGEHASAHHAWIVGALESAVRGVFQMFESLHILKPENPDYITAMEFLDRKDVGPFGPIPREFPRRQKDKKVDDSRNVPEEGKDLTYAAAQILLSFLEMMFEADQKKASTTSE
ncbi:hypothetical protein AOQ84DRAFT_163539 [Glonium stellatum]|uniref:Amine oxidase domain-containing protein n=1 Tax=Glonium stellatum TaxID=574774 RepID=A0A8E2JZK3_9PEZI|nr:hypothetical protein AOQ84DRAFT_163539 [Glonium stellatum]